MSFSEDGDGPVYHDLLQFAIELEAISYTTLKFLDSGEVSVGEIRSRKDIRPAFEPLAKSCVSALNALLERVDGELEQRSIKAQEHEALKSEAEKMSTVFEKHGLIAPERAFASATRVEELLERLAQDGARLPREDKKRLGRELKRLKLRCAAYEVYRAKTTISNLIPQIRKKARVLNASALNGQKTTLSDLSRSIRLVESIMRPSIKGNGISFEVQIEPGKYAASIDRQRFEYCLKLLLDNALKYTDQLPEETGYEEPWIKVRAFDRNDRIDLTVDSWGTPITHEELEKRLIFKRGFRGHFAIAADIQGTGTGLAEVDDFVQGIGGRIEVETRAQSKFKDNPLPQKTVFTLRMPKQ